MNTIKDKISEFKNHFKEKLIEYILIKTSIKAISNAMRKFYIIPIGFDEIYYGIKNPRRFKVCFLLCIYMYVAIIWHFLFIISPELWSLVDNPFLPDHLKQLFVVLALFLLVTASFKTDFLIGDINGNLSIYSLLHILNVNNKSLHKLTDEDYNRLILISRFVIMVMFNYGSIVLVILGIATIIFFCVLSNRLMFCIHFILMSPSYLLTIITILASGCTGYTYFSYYKLRYDQLKCQIKSIERLIRKRKRIFIGRQKIFLELIHEHNSLAIEIQKSNLLLRRTVAIMFICFSLNKIITLYIAIYVKHILIRILAVNIFVLLFIFGFGLSILYSLQIDSSKSSYKIIHSIVCNCKMNIRLRLQVI